jgi:hydrogenase nickel incorporation protein HypB
MCTTCGCDSDGATVHPHPPHHHHDHPHDHPHTHGPAGAWAPPATGARRVLIEQDLLARNDRQAALNRATFAGLGLRAMNLVSSPGSGKTTLLVRTIERLAGHPPVAVIEGDQQTQRDAERIRATGAAAVQINTGKGCHLDAQMVAQALPELPLPRGGLLLIENVGNLVCPAAFDLGEAHKVLLFSVTEGEDKPLKYPDMFRAADLVLLSKCDLLPHLDFDVAQAEAYARQVHPQVQILRVSATTGQGMDAWLEWLRQPPPPCPTP